MVHGIFVQIHYLSINIHKNHPCPVFVHVYVSPKRIPWIRTVSCGLFYQAHYQRALQRCEDGVLSKIGLRMPSKSQAAMGSEEAFVRDVLKRPGKGRGREKPWENP